MMFRNVEEDEEESASDWDDLSVHISAQPRPKTPPEDRSPSPPQQHHTISPPAVSSPSIDQNIVQERSLTITNGSALQDTPPKIMSRETDGGGREFDSLSRHQESTTPHSQETLRFHSAHQSKYTLQNSPPPPPQPPGGASLVPPLMTVQNSGTTNDGPPINIPIRPPSVESDDHLLQPNTGRFKFDAVVNSRKLQVEREVVMQSAVLAGYANRSEKMFSRMFQEFFSLFRIFTDFIITFVLECAHCFAFHILRKLLCGLLFTFLSAVCIPGLTDCFNIIIWPLALFVAQLGRAVQLVLKPCGECLDWMAGRCVEMVTAFRPVNIVWTNSRSKDNNR